MMIKSVEEIAGYLKAALSDHEPHLKIRVDTENNFEVAGTKPGMQGRQKVDGFFFANIVPKPKDVRLYFFPIYTHPDQFELSADLQKALKGKSCFHIKKITPEMGAEINGMIKKGVDIYLNDGLI